MLVVVLRDNFCQRLSACQKMTEPNLKRGGEQVLQVTLRELLRGCLRGKAVLGEWKQTIPMQDCTETPTPAGNSGCFLLWPA